VSKTTKCCDFTVIFPLSQKCTVILPIFTAIFLQSILMGNIVTEPFCSENTVPNSCDIVRVNDIDSGSGTV